MTENQENNEAQEQAVVYVGHMRAYARRTGCLIAVLLWSLFMLFPMFLFLLAINGEIALWHGGNFPENESHPLLQVKLLSEIQTRGLNITASYVAESSETAACVQTDVRYLLWQGRGENISYCDCYTRETAQSTWTPAATTRGVCVPQG